jgi:hypothetical protein
VSHMDAMAPELNLPEGAIPTGEIRIVTYLDEGGVECYGYSMSDGMLRSQVIGVLYYVIHIQAHRAEGDDFGEGEPG